MTNIELNNKEKDFLIGLLEKELDSTHGLTEMQTSQNILRKIDSSKNHYTYLSDSLIRKGYDT